MTREEAINQLKINKQDYTYMMDDDAVDMAIKALGHTSPCDLCRHNPPSSGDGKPCSMCPACSGGNEE